MKADELWEKYFSPHNHTNVKVISKLEFLSCLTEYGNAVKREAVKVCNEETRTGLPPMWISVAQKCAAAIEKLEIK